MRRKLPYQLSAIGVFLLLKIAYTQADSSNLAFLLRPTDALVSLAAGSPSSVHPDGAFFYADLNILIDKSCSGFSFWIISFLLFSFLAIKCFSDKKHLLLGVPSALFCAYFLTLFANSSRIVIALFFKNRVAEFSFTHSHWFHEALGVFVYLSCLIVTYLLTEFLLLKTTRSNAQPA